jgi:hypothetical protein
MLRATSARAPGHAIAWALAATLVACSPPAVSPAEAPTDRPSATAPPAPSATLVEPSLTPVPTPVDELSAAKARAREPIEREIEEIGVQIAELGCETITDEAELEVCLAEFDRLDNELMGFVDGLEVLDRCLLSAATVAAVEECAATFYGG